MIYSHEFCPCRWLGAYTYIDPISDGTTSSTTENPSQETTTSTETVVYPVSAVDYSETLISIYLVLCAILVAVGVTIGIQFMNTLFKRWF